MDDEQKVNQLASTLFSKGLAASLWDAKNKARDILGINSKVTEKMNNSSNEEGQVFDIMEGAGVDLNDVNEAENEKIMEIKEEFQQSLAEEEAKATVSADNISSAIIEDTNSEELDKEPGKAEKVELPGDIFFVEGATPDMTVEEAARAEIQGTDRDSEGSLPDKRDASEEMPAQEEQEKMFSDYSGGTNEPEAEEDKKADGGQTEEELRLGDDEQIANGDDLEDIEEPGMENVPDTPENTEYSPEAESAPAAGSEELAESQKSDYLYIGDQENPRPEERFSDEIEKEEIPKIIDDEFREKKGEAHTIIEGEGNVFSDVDSDKAGDEVTPDEIPGEKE